MRSSSCVHSRAFFFQAHGDFPRWHQPHIPRRRLLPKQPRLNPMARSPCAIQSHRRRASPTHPLHSLHRHGENGPQSPQWHSQARREEVHRACYANRRYRKRVSSSSPGSSDDPPVHALRSSVHGGYWVGGRKDEG